MADPERPTDLGDELPVDPETDFEKYDPPAGTWEADIAIFNYERRSDDEEYDPGLNQARVSYRLNDDNLEPKFHGVLVSGFGRNLTMITNGGRDKAGSWIKWCKSMGYDHTNPPKASEVRGTPVTIRTGTKPGKRQNADRSFVTVEQVWKRGVNPDDIAS